MDAWTGCSTTGSVARGHNFVLANGSCFELVKLLPDTSVDLICIDPPYTQGSAAPVDPKVRSYQNVAWSEAEWRAILREGTRILRKGGKQLIFCSNTLRRELESLVDSESQHKMDCPYVWERAGNLLTTADRVSYAYREPALEFVLVIQQRHEVAASSMSIMSSIREQIHLKKKVFTDTKMALTQEERIERNRTRCKRYYDTHQNKAQKRRVINQIKSKGYFPRAIECVSTLELVDAFTCYQQAHTPSEFALRKYRSLLAGK